MLQFLGRLGPRDYRALLFLTTALVATIICALIVWDVLRGAPLLTLALAQFVVPWLRLLIWLGPGFVLFLGVDDRRWKIGAIGCVLLCGAAVMDNVIVDFTVSECACVRERE